MRKYLLKKVRSGQTKPKLKEMPLHYTSHTVHQSVQQNAGKAVWTVLRWWVLVYPWSCTVLTPCFLCRIIGSCTAYLEEINADEEKIKNLDLERWRQVSLFLYGLFVNLPSISSPRVVSILCRCTRCGSKVPARRQQR